MYLFFSYLVLNNSTHVQLILKGKRNISSDQALEIGTSLGLKNQELNYFHALVHLNQSKNPIAKNFWEQEISRIKAH